MLGTSRESLASLQAGLIELGVASESNFAADVLQAAASISTSHQLLMALVDSGSSVEARKALVAEMFGKQIGPKALELVVRATSTRWASEFDLGEALEVLAAQAVFTSNPADLDRIESEIFAFNRAVETNPNLQMALTNPATANSAKAALVGDLLQGQVAAGSLMLLQHLAANLRGRRVDVALRSLSEAAAAARNRTVALVKVASPITADQAQRLAAVLGRLSGKEVSLNVIVDPSVIGGVSVRLGDEVIDGTVRTRLDQARRALVG